MAVERVKCDVDVEIDGASTAAKARFVDSIRAHALRLAVEVKEVESRNRRNGVTDAEVTVSTVVEAEDRLRKRLEEPKISILTASIRITVPVSALFAGILGSYLHSTWQIASFGALAMLAVITSVASVVRKG